MDNDDPEIREADLPPGFSPVGDDIPEEDETVVEVDPLAEEGEATGKVSLLIGEDLTPEEEAYFLGADGADYEY